MKTTAHSWYCRQSVSWFTINCTGWRDVPVLLFKDEPLDRPLRLWQVSLDQLPIRALLWQVESGQLSSNSSFIMTCRVWSTSFLPIWALLWQVESDQLSSNSSFIITCSVWSTSFFSNPSPMTKFRDETVSSILFSILIPNVLFVLSLVVLVYW